MKTVILKAVPEQVEAFKRVDFIYSSALRLRRGAFLCAEVFIGFGGRSPPTTSIHPRASPTETLVKAGTLFYYILRNKTYIK